MNPSANKRVLKVLGGVLALSLFVGGRLGGANAATVAAGAALPGDERSTPQVITRLGSAAAFYVRDYTTAGDDPIIPCLGTAGYQTVWLSYTASDYGLLVFDTDTDETTFDTALAIWVEQPDGALRLVTCDCTDSETGRGMADVVAHPGTTYLVEVAAVNAGATWLKVWLHACSALPLPPEAPGLCAYPGPETLTEPACVVGMPIGSRS